MFHMRNFPARTLAILSVLAMAIGFTACQSGDKGAPSPEEMRHVLDKASFAKGIKQSGAVVVDLRAPFDYERSHIEKAINIYFFDPEFKYKVLELSRDKKYYLYDKNMVTAERAMDFMNRNEFRHVYVLQEGWESWNKASTEPQAH